MVKRERTNVRAEGLAFVLSRLSSIAHSPPGSKGLIISRGGKR